MWLAFGLLAWLFGKPKMETAHNKSRSVGNRTYEEFCLACE